MRIPDRPPNAMEVISRRGGTSINLLASEDYQRLASDAPAAVLALGPHPRGRHRA